MGGAAPRSQKRDLHPANKDPFAGTPDLGHPGFWFPWTLVPSVPWSLL
jgi:hypothetical protein